MIIAAIVILAIYLAVRFTLSETSQKLNKFRDIWKQAVCVPNAKRNRKYSDIAKKIKVIKEVFKTSGDATEQASQHPRRRTGAVNGRVQSRKPKVQRLSTKQLRLPFMDTGLFHGAGFHPGTTSPSTRSRKTSREQKYSIEKDGLFKGDKFHLGTISPSTHSRRSSREQKYAIEKDAKGSIHATDESVFNMFKVPTENRNCNLFSRLFYHASFILQRNSSINYSDVSEEVLSSERVKSAIKTAAMEELKGQYPDDTQILIAELNHKQRAISILQDMRSCISSFLLKVAAWVMYKLLGRMLDGIEVHREQLQMIRRVSQNDVPIVYLPLHRSHLDYILVTFILYMNDLRAPLVAAGNNLMIPFFGALLRGLGAFFIKRKLDPQQGQRDFVYRAILHTYMEKSLVEGHSLEFFIEGGRSRTGKAVLPKAGLLSIVVDTLVSGGICDAYIVPISMSYEKLLDGNFVAEQMGKPKKMESFTSAVQAIWRTLHSCFGTVRVDFCQPFSLKEFLLAAEYSYNLPANNLPASISKQSNCFISGSVKARRRSEYGTEIVTEDHRQVIKDLADYIVYDAFNVNSLMSTSIISFLLTTKHRKGTTYHQLLKSVNWLREEVKKRNKSVGFHGDSSELIKKACSLLGRELISIENIQMEWSSGNLDNNVSITFYKPSVNLPEVLELQYYANAVLPVFLLESIIVNAFCSLTTDGSVTDGGKHRHFSREQVLKQSLQLCDILQYEFIFSPPGTSLYTVLSAAIDDMISNGLLETAEDTDKADRRLNTADAVSLGFQEETIFKREGPIFEDEEESDLFIQKLMMCCDEESENSSMLQFLRCILTPFIESYYLVSVSVVQLANHEMEESSLIQESKKLGQKKLSLGHLCYEECLGLDLIKNALKLFESWKIIKNTTSNSKKTFSLHPMCSTASLDDVIARISKFRS